MCMARWYQKLSATYTASLFLFEVSALSDNKTQQISKGTGFSQNMGTENTGWLAS